MIISLRHQAEALEVTGGIPCHTRALPPQGTLHRLFDYDPRVGRLIWRNREDMPRKWNARYAGRFAGTTVCGPGGRSHRRVRIDGVQYLEHRIIWKHVHGCDPNAEIDHINIDATDNRVENLRCATRSENLRNVRIRSNNSSGFKGVHLHKKTKMWVARIAVCGRRFSLGYFDTKREAGDAYAQASKKLHGEFGRSR